MRVSCTLLGFIFYNPSLFPAVPGAPRHLKVDNVSRNGVSLSWQKPSDDGGNPVQGYILEKKSPDSPRWFYYVLKPFIQIVFFE